MKKFKNLLLLILPIWSFNLFATDIDNDEVFACAIEKNLCNCEELNPSKQCCLKEFKKLEKSI